MACASSTVATRMCAALYSVPGSLAPKLGVVGGLDRLFGHALGGDALGRLNGAQGALLVLEHEAADPRDLGLAAQDLLLDELFEDAVEQRLGGQRLVLLRQARAQDEHVAQRDVGAVHGGDDGLGRGRAALRPPARRPEARRRWQRRPGKGGLVKRFMDRSFLVRARCATLTLNGLPLTSPVFIEGPPSRRSMAGRRHGQAQPLARSCQSCDKARYQNARFRNDREEGLRHPERPQGEVGHADRPEDQRARARVPGADRRGDQGADGRAVGAGEGAAKAWTTSCPRPSPTAARRRGGRSACAPSTCS
jgi:hypothetical protein